LHNELTRSASISIGSNRARTNGSPPPFSPPPTPHIIAVATASANIDMQVNVRPTADCQKKALISFLPLPPPPSPPPLFFPIPSTPLANVMAWIRKKLKEYVAFWRALPLFPPPPSFPAFSCCTRNQHDVHQRCHDAKVNAADESQEPFSPLPPPFFPLPPLFIVLLEVGDEYGCLSYGEKLWCWRERILPPPLPLSCC